VIGLGVAFLFAAATMLATSSARAADSVWWTHAKPGGFSWAAVDASVAGNLPTPGLVLPRIQSMAIDAAGGRAYFVSPDDRKLHFVKLDGSGGGEVPMPGITLAGGPHGLAIDAAAGRAYLPDPAGDKIYMVKLDGSGGGPVNTTGVTVDDPWAIAVDPAGGRVYWGSSTGTGTGKLQYARLDGSGAGEIATTGATPPGPLYGIAVDSAAGRVYWSTVPFAGSPRISVANTDGGGGSDLNTAGATLTSPRGLALDTAGGRIYWADLSDTIGFARLDNTGGANLTTFTATVTSPWGVNRFSPPVNTAAPTATGQGTLTCSDGTWAPDVPGAFLARAPQTLTYTWARDGQVLADATAKTLAASQPGAYTCTVTATNQAGATRQASVPVTVTGAVMPPAGRPGDTTPPRPPVTPSIRIAQITQKRVIRLTTTVPGTVTITAGDKAKKLKRTLDAGSFSLRFSLSKKARTTLQRNRRLSIIFTAKLVPSGGGKALVTQKSVLLTLPKG
jgi:DNA-binding beta-propeller fold protein YncE